MGSFLGVPIVARGEVVGAFYLTDKEDAEEFSVEDQELIEMLAPHAAVAMENARLYERSRELSIVEERNRLARELHDSLVQKLFGVVLAAQSAGTLLERDLDAAREQVERSSRSWPRRRSSSCARWCSSCARRRSRRRAWAPRCASTSSCCGARTGRRSSSSLSGSPRLRPGVDEEVFRIAQESLQNALRHARAGRIELRLDEGAGGLRLTVADDGVGFEPGRGRPALAPARPDLDGGARPRARGAAADRVRAGPRNDDRPGGGL